MSVAGGFTKPRPATAEDQAVADKVKDQFVTKSGTHPSKFKVHSVITQVVAGMNYWMEVDVGNNAYVHLHVYEPLPGVDDKPKLESYKLNKKKGDKLGDC
ncbi:leukocyte cysteine proteinase inhibitor 1-like [Rana temporaria]|uniref:leukocyte cysteine proteinase inhibitor 1-like n=1 Tax=Rana temporaria TaxID=8407 RepID=UPI001AACE109|nr:leukocyte cysteine proteinase inhibitor 1-like [Rana temporaria]